MSERESYAEASRDDTDQADDMALGAGRRALAAARLAIRQIKFELARLPHNL